MNGRIIMPFEEWPELDRALWLSAQEPADFLGEHGKAANWAPSTVATRRKDYGVWLQFLSTTNRLVRGATPAHRVTSDVVQAWHDEMQRRRNSPVTIAGRIEGLAVMIFVLQPAAQIGWLWRLSGRLSRAARPTRNKQAKLVHPADILNMLEPLLIELMTNHHLNGRKRLAYLRNALTLAVMTFVPVRLKNHAGMKLDKNIAKMGDHYEFFFSADETKTKKPYSGCLPKHLTEVLDIYINEVRPRLLGDHLNEHLWVSYRHGAVSAQTIYMSTVRLTAEKLGNAIGPHLLRDIAASWFATEKPDTVLASATVLGHASIRSTQEHYNNARMLVAVRQFQGGIG